MLKGCFIPRKWRLNKVVWALLLLEFPFTVANLALFGIAAPNLYRTILWKEGGRMGFNSDPTTVLYAAANYRPVKTPIVWSGFNTQYNLVIGVLCMFFYLIKCTLFLMHVLYPIISLPLHAGLMSLWAYSIYMQTAPDTIDPRRQNKGAPWYLTKSCDIMEDKTIRGYCMQAKSAFAVSVIMLALYAIFMLLSLYSLIPTSSARESHAARRASKKAEKEKYATSPYSTNNEMTSEEQWQHMWELQQLPRTPGATGGFKTPMTPRTRAFQDLGGDTGAGAGGHGHAWPPVPAPSGYYQQDMTMPIPASYSRDSKQQNVEYQTNAGFYGDEIQRAEQGYGNGGADGQVHGLGFKEEEWKGKAAAY